MAGVLGAAGGGVTPILPTAITGLWAWYERGEFYSDAGVTLQTTNGGSVQQWSDSSGNGRHLSRTSQKPTVDTGTTHLGQNTLHFSPGGSFQALNFPSSPAGPDGEYFIVAKAASDAPGTSRGIHSMTGAGNGAVATLYPDTSGHIKEIFAIPSSGSSDCGAQTLADAFHVLNTGVDSSKVLETRRDGVLIGNPTLTTRNANQFGYLGTDPLTATPFDGWIFELVIFTAKLSADDRAGLFVYLTT